MSYIRCLSNPEGLYIYGGPRDRITINHNIPKPRAKPGFEKGQNPPEITIPKYIFEHVCRRWNDGFESIKFRGCKVELTSIEWETGRKVSNNLAAKKWLYDKVRREFLVRFEYEKKYFYMWLVTWNYIVNNACNRL